MADPDTPTAPRLTVALTVDTVRQVPSLSHEDAMTAEVVRGKHLWDRKNCMGCHTILGEGAYYAPELTRVVERRGKEWIALFLRDPEAMFPVPDCALAMRAPANMTWMLPPVRSVIAGASPLYGTC